jgi:competence protein ComEA
VVYVAGAVRHGGLFTLPAGARAMDALRAAGGASEGADLVAVNLAQQLADGDEVAVPSLDGPSQGAAPGRRAHRSKRGSHGRKHRHHHRRSAPLAVSADTGDASDGPASVVDLNTADESELETLPGVGATLAARIVTFREATGAFSTPDDLLDVSGVTQSKLDAIEPYVTTGAAAPQP